MRFFSTFFLAFLFLLSPFVMATETSEDQKLEAFLEEEWEWTLKENPVFATLTGDLRYNDQIDDVSKDAVLRRQQHEQEALKEIGSFDRARLSSSNQLNYDLYLDRLNRQVEGHRFPDYLMPITQLGGIHQDSANLVTALPFRNTKEYEDYLARLKKFPVTIDQTIALMKEGLQKKITPAKITLRDVEKQIQAQVLEDPQKSPFYEPFKKFPETVSTTDQQRLRKEGAQIIRDQLIPAFQKLHEYWTKEYYPQTRESIGYSALPDGKAWYEYLVKYYTTTDMSAEQIHQLGLNEVKRIRQEMDEIIRSSGFKGTFSEFLEFLRTDPQFFYKKPEDLLTGYRDICKRIDAELPKLFGKLPRNSYGVREIPEYSAPSQTTAYYSPGSLKAGRPGWFYANTYQLETRPKWEMEALSIHEAVPGHHLQLSLAQEMENVPKFRNYGFYTAFIEGWGLYSESLGSEMGFYKDPYSKFGQLTYEMWRAVRLVVDTGMHAFEWDRQKAIDFFKANSSKPEHDIIVEIDRYIVIPGQALAYKIGQIKIRQVRDYAQQQLGEKFDIREFHDHVLGNGAVPLSMLEKQVKQYVAEKKQGNAEKQ
jgi:uncharacterized protein (DUF885 family)